MEFVEVAVKSILPPQQFALGGLLNFRSLCGRLLRVLVFGPRHRDC